MEYKYVKSVGRNNTAQTSKRLNTSMVNQECMRLKDIQRTSSGLQVKRAARSLCCQVWIRTWSSGQCRVDALWRQAKFVDPKSLVYTYELVVQELGSSPPDVISWGGWIKIGVALPRQSYIYSNFWSVGYARVRQFKFHNSFCLLLYLISKMIEILNWSIF